MIYFRPRGAQINLTGGKNYFREKNSKQTRRVYGDRSLGNSKAKFYLSKDNRLDGRPTLCSLSAMIQ